MFCTKCGENLLEGTNFCSKCGTKVNGNTSIAGQQNTEKQKTKVIKVLRISSVICFIIFPFCMFGLPMVMSFSYSAEDSNALSMVVLYPFIYSIIVLLQGIKHKINVMKNMAIITIILSIVYYFGITYGINSNEILEIMPFMFLFWLYALVFSIVTFVKSKIKDVEYV